MAVEIIVPNGDRRVEIPIFPMTDKFDGVSITIAKSDEDLAKIIASAVAEVAASGATGPSAMGAVMKIVSPQVTGRADGGAVAAAVKSALA
jgi:Glu-tRNA(Gln) amidotransferase subunit E-like FAD-binding protein